MAEYHVGCGIARIYAGTINETGLWWVNKSDVTEEVLNAAAQFLLENKASMEFDYDNKRYRLAVTQAEMETDETE